MSKRSGVRELDIENGIIDYLRLRQVFAWKAKTIGTWDNNKSIYRRTSKRYMKGICDIIGIYKGKPLGVEVKTGNLILVILVKVLDK